MRKLRADSTWTTLKPEQREALETWLFEENIGYHEALERIEKEFAVKASLGSLARFYRRTAEQRAHSELEHVLQTAGKFAQTDVDVDELMHVSMTLVAKKLIQTAIERPNDVRSLANLARTMVSHRAVEVKNGWLEIESGREISRLQDEERRREDNRATNERVREQMNEYFARKKKENEAAAAAKAAQKAADEKRTADYLAGLKADQETGDESQPGPENHETNPNANPEGQNGP